MCVLGFVLPGIRSMRTYVFESSSGVACGLSAGRAAGKTTIGRLRRDLQGRVTGRRAVVMSRRAAWPRGTGPRELRAREGVGGT